MSEAESSSGPRYSRATSPYSSGGGGETFERKAAVLWLARLLIGETEKGLGGLTVQQVAFQKQDYPCDDLIVTAIGEDPTDKAVLEVAVRNSPRFIPSDPRTSKLVRDLLNSERASRGSQEQHSLAICVSGQQRDAKEVAELASIARVQNSAPEFFSEIRGLRRKNRAHRSRLDYLVALVRQNIDADADDPEENAAELGTWQVLRRLHVFMPSIESPDDRDWVDLLNRLKHVTRRGTTEAARNLRDRLVALVSDYGPKAASVDIAMLRRDAGGELSPTRPVVGQALNLPMSDLLRADGPPVAFSANLPSTASYSTLPVDVGTVWGLDRGPFVGLFVGEDPYQIGQALVRAESAVRTAEERVGASRHLPKRTWVSVDGSVFPLGPENRDDLLLLFPSGLAAPADSSNSENLLGLLVLVPAVDEEEQIGVCRGWIAGAYRVVETRRLAIVFLMQNGIQKEYDFDNRLRQHCPVPFQRLISSVSFSQPTVSVTEVELPEQSLMEIGRRYSADEILATWIDSLLRSDCLTADTIQGKFPRLASWVVQLPDDTKRKVRELRVPGVVEIVRALEELDADDLFILEILRVVFDFIDARTAARSAAASASERLRLAALRACACAPSGAVDSLIDAWLEGHSLVPEEMPSGAGLVAYPAEVAEPLALGLMRKLANAGGKHKKAELCMEQIYNCLRPHIRRTWESFRNPSARQDLLEGSKSCEAAFRSGLTQLHAIHLAPHLLEDLVPACWWLLQAQPPLQDQVEVLLSLRHDRRVVVGLATGEEREDCAGDQSLAGELNACRRGRKAL